MAKISPDRVASGPAIEAIAADGGFRIDGEVLEAALLTPEAAIPWAPPAIDALDPSALGDLLTRDPAPEFLLLGTGATLRRPSPAFTAALEAQGIGVEVMDSRAAARAWGVLRAEGREIVAALMGLER
ncbi:Mth938-like domain-containing protein [Sphingomonas oryzagri]|uniref:Mth938-like domain-containing protein n=1 Tax=Sphingomonas oryzagri TaxID=3042314 RepID=A0ABT6N4U7_9SPHN|nr:Mth938-like domain-containing protein [Sphingomonas oryzagri]MDH7639816.1 Mth938-like domain-containing protein [Sphingomonas oryzagri]